MGRYLFFLIQFFFCRLIFAENATENSSSNISLKLEAEFTIDKTHNQGLVSGKVTYDVKKQFKDQKVICFYLPYLDPHYTYDPIRSFDLIPRKFVDFEKTPGTMDMAHIQSPKNLEIKSEFIRVWTHDSKETLIQFNFTAAIPRWHDSDQDEWFFNDFYPQILESCPSDPSNSFSIPTVSILDIDSAIQFDTTWKNFSSGLEKTAKHFTLTAQKIVFGFFKDFKKTTVDWNDTIIEFISTGDAHEKEIEFLKEVFVTQTKIFGKLPFKKLVFVDTADVEKSSIPGLIAINRPKQLGASQIQEESSNWTFWQLATFVSEQWFGASSRVRSLDDLWLLRGFNDFATIETLQKIANTYDLIQKKQDNPKSGFQFDYRQFQDLLAAVLTYVHPFNALTDVDSKTIEPFDKQHSLSYIRHTLALRQMNWTTGRDTFRTILSEFFAAFAGKNIEPKNFYNFIATRVAVMSKTQSLEMGKILMQWWTTENWPDFEIMDVDQESKGDGYEISIHIRQNNGFSLPLNVLITDNDQKKYEVEARPDPKDKYSWIATTKILTKYDRIELEPTRQIFDWNRFNNKTSLPPVHFFPGPLKTFADDAYTVFWLPLLTKLPGEPFTYFLVTQGFKYVQSSFTAILTYIPEQNRYGYSFYYLTDFPKLGSYMVVDAIADKGRTYKNEQLMDVGLYRTINFIKDPVIEYGVRIRNRETLNEPDTRHQTLAFKAQSSPLNQHGTCTHAARFEIERTVHAQNPKLSYARQFALAEGSCQVFEELEAGARVFLGTVHSFGDVTRNLFFNPQEVTEARLRFDSPDLNKVESISTLGLDLLTPAHIPFPDFLWVINRQARWRGFYDFGLADNPQATYSDAGVGLWVPFGGDLVGKGSVTVLNFSILAVLYRQAGNYESSELGVIFDFDFFGKL